MEVEFSKENFILPELKYEYLDHTADVQLHAWGYSLKEAFEQCGMAMFGYMTDLAYVTVRSCYKIEASGDYLESLLFHFLDELLLQMRSFVKRFYQNWLVCDDPACNLNTRSYTHVMCQRKFVCMRCNNGFLIRQYTAHDLNIQLSFFHHIFD